MVEKVIDWQDGRAYRAELSEFSLPLNRAIATLSVEPVDAGRSRAKMRMDFEVKYGPIGWLMGKTMMSRMMGGLFLIVLRGLEERVVSGPKAAACQLSAPSEDPRPPPTARFGHRAT